MSRAQELLRELAEELADRPEPVGYDLLREDLKTALRVIDRLLDRLDEYHLASQKGQWTDPEGNPVDPPADWLMLECFDSDHELYDEIRALRGRNGLKWRVPRKRELS